MLAVSVNHVANVTRFPTTIGSDALVSLGLAPGSAGLAPVVPDKQKTTLF
jgi:hypothetical protein